MDPEVSRWVLEFLLRKSVKDALIKKIIQKVPLSNSDWRLKKAILLRTIQDDMSKASVQETMLEALEFIEELDRCNGTAITPAMSAAYCAVAVECTVRYLELELSPANNASYLDAVERIWRCRIPYMEPSASSEGSLLFSDELKLWRDDIEASVKDLQVCERLISFNRRRDALNKLKDYLAEAWANMGPSFIELVASFPKDMGPSIVELGESLRKDKALQNFTGNLVESIKEVTATTSGRRGEGTSTDFRTHHIDTHTTELHCQELEIQKDNRLLKRKHTEVVNPSTSCSKNDSVLSAEVQKVRESLKCSSEELQMLVKDPLPDALHMSDIVRSESTLKDMNQQPPIENQSKDADVLDPHVCKSVNNNDTNLNKAASVHRSDVHHPSLMERNSTACTHEWDDSMDDLPEGTSNHASKIRLPSPRRKNISPLKKYEAKNIAKRRKPKKWSQMEEDTLRAAIDKFGKGNWKVILSSHRDIFEERTEVDLKDKWRNMTRYGGK